LRERLPEAVVKCLANKPPKLVSGSFVDNLIQVYCYDERMPRRIIHEVRPEEEETMISQFAQDIERAVCQKALQEGIQQGIQQGTQQGLLEGEQGEKQKGKQNCCFVYFPAVLVPYLTRSPSGSIRPTRRPLGSGDF